MTAAIVTVRGGEIGLPANAEIQGEIRAEAITILRVKTVVTLPPVLLFIISLGKAGHGAQHEIDQRVSNYYYEITKRNFVQVTVPQKIFSGAGYLPFPAGTDLRRSKYSQI